MVTSIAIISLLLLIWFRTDAWLEFCRLLHLNFLSDYKGYLIRQIDDPTLRYLMFLRIYHNCFLIRLITCPLCLSVWLTIGLSLLTGGLATVLGIIGGVGLGEILSALITVVFNFPLLVLGSLAVYGAINKLLS